jgi:transposase InsO family protein
MSVPVLFPWIDEAEEARLYQLKWIGNGTKYEFHLPKLFSRSIDAVVAHCIEVKDTIEGELPDEELYAQAFFNVFPRTLSKLLKQEWKQLEGESEFADYSVNDFEELLMEFVASHSSEQDRFDLVNQLRQPTKPPSQSVQSFYSRLLELNDAVELLPGDEEPLNEKQLKKAFYDGMPSTWKDRFMSSGESFSKMTRNQVVRYFRDQETLATKKKNENETSQKKTKGKRPAAELSRPKNQRDRTKRQDTRVKDSDPCPKHPNGSHTWGACRSRKNNKPDNQTASRDVRPNRNDKSKAKSKEANSYLVDVSEEAEPPSHEGMPTCFTIETLAQFDDQLTSTFFSNDTQTEPLEEAEVLEAYYMAMKECLAIGDDNSELGSKNNEVDQKELPIGIMTVETIQGQSFRRPLKVLFDTGSSRTLINQRILPSTIKAHQLGSPVTLHTGGGTMQAQQGVKIHQIRFPELSPTRTYTVEVEAIVSQHTALYDVILGHDVMVSARMMICCDTKTIRWGDLSVPWKEPDFLKGTTFQQHLQATLSATPADVGDDSFTVQLTSKEILSSKYEQVDTQAMAQQQKHLTQRQRDDLAQLLSNFTTLFSGKLGCYPHEKVHLELNDKARPFHHRPYPIPHAHMQVFKEELDRLEELGVLSKTGPAKYLSPTFIIPKKDGRVRWVSDFRTLNTMITRKVYHLPRIHDILRKRSRYLYFTKLDISMQYYTFELDDASKEVCTICTPLGNYRYNRLPMGIKQSPDIAQQIMETLLRPHTETDVYIDDIGIFAQRSWEEHLLSLYNVLKLLQDNNFTVNPLKCEWAVKETDWLGYWLTPEGVKPWRKKIEPILAILPPSSISELRSFVGSVNFYRDMFRKRSHMLAPLTSQSGKKKIDWTPECQTAFEQVKATLAKEAFLQYPDHNKPFHIYSDASDYQMGSVIMQEGKPVAFFSRKLNSAQRNYTTGEKEILSIVETLKEYKTMLFGCREIHIYTDHRNLTFTAFQTQRVLRWRLFLEEYGPILHYIEGSKNLAADALSRLPFSERQTSDSGISDPGIFAEKPADILRQQSTRDDSFFSIVTDDPELLDCFVHLPDQHEIPFQMDYQTIAEAQVQDAVLLQQAQAKPLQVQRRLLAPGIHVYCYIATPGGQWKIYLPSSLLRNVVRWYHFALGHCGTSRLADTLRMHFHNPQLQLRCEEEVQKCDPCQRHKNVGRGHGETASREAPLLPWQDVAVDLIGPWTLAIGDQKLKFSALTMIDMVTNLVEVVRVNNKTAAHIAMHFENTWLSRYPRPLNVIHDQGGEFIGYEFLRRLQVHNIRSRTTTAKNPQANSVCERMHQAIGNTLRVLYTMEPPQGVVQAEQLVDTAIADAVYATRCTYHSTLKTTPGGLAFGRDMILNIPLVTDLQQLQKRRQELIDKRLIEANTKRFAYDYSIGDEVLRLVYQPDKLEARAIGPYTITRVHSNGTLSIEVSPGVIERVNLRRVKPYRR